jgi:uncharacterized protein YjlB
VLTRRGTRKKKLEIVQLGAAHRNRKRVNAGESLYIPGGMRHNEFGTSDDLEILEVVLPGEMGTVPCPPPAGMKP